MKLQNIYVNDRFDHVLDYDSNNSVVEKFIIQSPVTGTSMPLMAFSTHRNEKYFLIETETGTKSCFFNRGNLEIVEDRDGLKRITVELLFSYSNPNANASKTGKTANKGNWGDGDVRKSKDIERHRENICNLKNIASICWDKIDGDYKQVLWLNMDGLDELCVEVNVKLNLECQEEYGNVTRTKSLVIYVAPKSNISDVILDFGSEASQMAVFRRDGEMNIDGFSDLFPNIKRKLTGEVLKEGTELNYHQYDDSNRKLFKSQFFIRRNVERAEVDSANANPSVALKTQPEMMKVLTTKEEVQQIRADYFQAPNIKLSGFGGIENLPHVEVDNQSFAVQNVGNYLYYRASVSLFIQQALDEVLKRKNDKYFVSFHFMMPNVYEQQEIVKILHLLQQDIEDMLRNKEYSNVKGVEVTAISESDASVMGVCELLRQKNNQLREGNYLLLDAGKGTLDFSLIKCESDSSSNGYVYKNLWRSGIVGAGNSLTYAYLIALIHQYLESRVTGKIGDDEIRRFIYGNILGRPTHSDGTAIPTAGDSALLLSMMRAVDRYKRCATYQTSLTEDGLNKVTDLNILELASFVDWLEECVNEEKQAIVGLTHNEYVENMIRALVDETVKKIRDFRALRGDEYSIDKVIFSGRAFNLQSFKNEMLNSLESVYKGIKEIVFTDNNASAISMKNICLVCANPIRYGNYNRKILSEPFLIQRGNVNDTNAQTAENDNTSVQKKSYFAIIIDKFKSLFYKSELNDNADTKIEDIRNNSFLNSGMDYKNGLEMFTSVSRKKVTVNNGTPLEGDEWTVKNPGYLSFNIGGKSYLPDGNIGLGVVKLFFTGERYIWRTEQASGSFQQTMNFANSPFLQSSFFPSFVPNGVQYIELIPGMDGGQAGTENEELDNVETPSPSKTDDELNELGKLLQNN